MIIRNYKGAMIGRMEVRGGDTYVYDKNGSYRGKVSNNMTYNEYGSLVAQGNAPGVLLKSILKGRGLGALDKYPRKRRVFFNTNSKKITDLKDDEVHARHKLNNKNNEIPATIRSSITTVTIKNKEDLEKFKNKLLEDYGSLPARFDVEYGNKNYYDTEKSLKDLPKKRN